MQETGIRNLNTVLNEIQLCGVDVVEIVTILKKMELVCTDLSAEIGKLLRILHQLPYSQQLMFEQGD